MFDMLGNSFENFTNLGVVVLLLILFVATMNYIYEGVAESFEATLNSRRQEEIENDLTQRRSRDIAASLTTLIALFCFIYTADFQILSESRFSLPQQTMPASVNFIAVVLLILFYLILRWAVLKTLDYVNQTGVFSFINRTSRIYITISSVAVIVGAIINYMLHNNVPNFFLFWGLVVMGIAWLLYIATVTKLLIKNKFSIFFYILYLCTLEILPVVLLLKAI